MPDADQVSHLLHHGVGLGVGERCRGAGSSNADEMNLVRLDGEILVDYRLPRIPSVITVIVLVEADEPVAGVADARLGAQAIADGGPVKGDK
jgi:hypothetical protein